jgi:hypothetical protein
MKERTMEDQQTSDQQELGPRHRALVARIDRLEAQIQDMIDKLNEAYRQASPTSARPGRGTIRRWPTMADPLDPDVLADGGIATVVGVSLETPQISCTRYSVPRAR